MANVFDEEGKEDTCHDDSGGGAFVFEFAETVVCEHQVGMCVELYCVKMLARCLFIAPWKNTYVNKSRSNDDTGSELLNACGNHGVQSLERQLDQQHRRKNTDCTGNKDDEQRSNAQRYIVVSVLDAA